MALASILREARLRAGLSQEELARRAGVAKSTVGRIETGARVPSTELLERLVRAAGFELLPTLSEPDPGTDAMFADSPISCAAPTRFRSASGRPSSWPPSKT